MKNNLKHFHNILLTILVTGIPSELNETRNQEDVRRKKLFIVLINKYSHNSNLLLRQKVGSASLRWKEFSFNLM